ncbi:hypothetical protein L1049_009577 [Liquidambar formosana]|uniref:VQ domain-containing protein n=1 Tax=Liquidambar formosana TaxID=63359 RepID=A0AAP0N7N4_LIQFO
MKNRGSHLSKEQKAQSSSMASARHEPVKVVLVDTKYVETDPMSFKSVVQSLTSKNSCVKWIGESSIVGQKRKSGSATAPSGLERPTCGGGGGSGGDVLTVMKDAPFEPPPVDGLHCELTSTHLDSCIPRR